MNVLVVPEVSGLDGSADPARGAPRRAASSLKLSVRGLAKRYGTAQALLPTDLDVAAGELLTVLGPSGSGKTTLLQLICGLAEPTAGRLFIDGVDETATPVHRRGIGVVFQNYALFPHLTVAENVSFPLEMRKLPAAELAAKVARALEMVGLAALGERFPRELSGGQQQRVALARCLVYEPALILMDEPLGALDRKLREAMQIEIKRLHRDTGATIIFVTHDQDEALALSDRICLMNNARIEQVGTPREIYERPCSLFAAEFVGLSNVLQGRIQGPGLLATPDGALPLPGGPRRVMAADRQGALIIRPEDIELAPGGAGLLSGRVVETVYGGAETRLMVALASGTVVTVRRLSRQGAVPVGEWVSLRWDADRAHVLPVQNSL